MKAALAWVLFALAAFALGVLFFGEYKGHLRGDTLVGTLQPLLQDANADRKLVAGAILGNYSETRQIAALWSGLYWGFAWSAAVLGALAGLVLKVESFLANEKVKKDIAALLTVTAAIMVTVSTGGDFQRKWHANRTAAAEIEHLGYEFLGASTPEPRAYLSRLSDILLRRHMAILGTTENRPAKAE